ncbi:hypothetical protein FF1_022471 [Malus domestica]|uniref:uncharacterized protein isoform X1 n=1 Tax=Malus domestica TaxID=3750 RepID=UPI003975B77C
MEHAYINISSNKLKIMMNDELNKKDEISSQISAQIFEFCDPELFQETLQNSEVTTSPNCCYEENSSFATNLSLPPDIETTFCIYPDNNGNTDANISQTPTTNSTNTTTTAASVHTTATTTTNATNNNSGNLSIIFDSQEEIDNDISASIDFSPSPPFSVPSFLINPQDQFDFSQMPLADPVVEGFSQYPAEPVPTLMTAPIASVFEEDCLSSVPSYVPLNPSSPPCSFLGPPMGPYMPTGPINPAALSADGTGIFTSSILMASELQQKDLEYQGDSGGIFFPDSLSRVFNPEELQALSAESQQLVSGGGNSTSLPTEIPIAEDPNFKVGKLSVEERKEKIHRYMKKRNERNFTKKIKYACRKTLADSRPRVRGRFAKNDDFGETHRSAGSNHEDDEDDEVAVKEEEDLADSSDIFAHISGVNSFKCSYPIQSWI